MIRTYVRTIGAKMTGHSLGDTARALGCCPSTARRLLDDPRRFKMWQLDALAHAWGKRPAELAHELLDVHAPFSSEGLHVSE